MPQVIIEAGRTERHYWQDLWRYRELFLFLAWRDIIVRYKQTVIGIAWALVRPVLTTVILTVLFNRIAGLKSTQTPYLLLVFTGMVPWQFFSNSLAECSNSLIANSNLVAKIYFPRLIVPASTVIVSFVDFLIMAVLLAGMMVWYHFVPTWRIVFLPLLIIASGAASMGVGLWLSALNVKYRDFRYIVPFIVQFGLFLSPVAISINHVPEKWRLLYSVNPMTGVIDGVRWCLLRGEDANIYPEGFLVSMLVIVVMFFSGIWYFRKVEKGFADII